MKKQAQIVCSILFVLITVKSFLMKVNAIDVTILLATSFIYCMYEFLLLNKKEEEYKLYKEETLKKLEKLQIDLDNTKNYMSKFSAQSLRK